MAVFNPNFQNPDPNYLGYSRGAEADRSLGSLFEMKGNLIQAETQATVSNIQSRINDEAREAVEPIRQGAIHALETGQLAVPNEVTSGITKAENLTQAKIAGRLNESHYWNLLDAEARRLRAAHPGFKDYVDQRIAELTGGTPANKMLQELYQEQRAGLGSAEKEYNHYEELLILAGGGAELEARKMAGKKASLSEIKTSLAIIKRDKADVDAQKSKLDLDVSQQKVKVENIKTVSRGEIGKIVNSAMAVGFAPYDELVKTINTAQPDKAGVYNPKDLEALRTAYGRLETMVQTRALRVFTDPSQGGNRYGDFIDKKDQADIIDQELAPLRVIKEAIFNQDFGTLGAMANRVKTIAETDHHNVLTTSQMAREIETIKSVYGPQWTTLLNLSDPGKFKDFTQKSIFQDGIIRSFNPETTKTEGMKTEFDRMKSAKAGPEVYRQHLDTHVKVLGDPKSDGKTLERAAWWMFGPGNKDFLTTVDPTTGKQIMSFTDPYSVYAKINNPLVAQNMQKFKDSNPDLYNNYRNFITGNFAPLMSAAAKGAQQLRVDSKFADVVWDSATLQFRVVPTGAPGSRDFTNINPIAPGISLFDAVEKGFTNPLLTKSVNDINNTLAGIKSLIQAEGGDPKTQIPDLVSRLPIKLDATKDGRNLWEKMIGSLQKSQAQEAKPAGKKEEGTTRSIAPTSEEDTAGRFSRLLKKQDEKLPQTPIPEGKVYKRLNSTERMIYKGGKFYEWDGEKATGPGLDQLPE